MWETAIWLLLRGRCRYLTEAWENLGSLLRNSMLPRVRDILLGWGATLLLVRFRGDTPRRGEWKGCRRSRFVFVDRALVTERTPAYLRVLLWAKLGKTEGNCPVNTSPLELGGFMRRTPRELVVVTLTVWWVVLRFTMLVKLVIALVGVVVKGVVLNGGTDPLLCRRVSRAVTLAIGQMLTFLMMVVLILPLVGIHIRPTFVRWVVTITGSMFCIGCMVFRRDNLFIKVVRPAPVPSRLSVTSNVSSSGRLQIEFLPPILVGVRPMATWSIGQAKLSPPTVVWIWLWDLCIVALGRFIMLKLGRFRDRLVLMLITKLLTFCSFTSPRSVNTVIASLRHPPARCMTSPHILTIISGIMVNLVMTFYVVLSTGMREKILRMLGTSTIVSIRVRELKKVLTTHPPATKPCFSTEREECMPKVRISRFSVRVVKVTALFKGRSRLGSTWEFKKHVIKATMVNTLFRYRVFKFSLLDRTSLLWLWGWWRTTLVLGSLTFSVRVGRSLAIRPTYSSRTGSRGSLRYSRTDINMARTLFRP